MTITSLALDDLITAFTDALTGANYRIAERHQALQNELREKYGKSVSALAVHGAAPRIRRGTITIMALPVIKKERGQAGVENRIYLKLKGLHKREMSFEILLAH
jgi:hypothetical protein